MGGSQVTKTTAQILLRTAGAPSIGADFRFNIRRLPETLPDSKFILSLLIDYSS